MFENNGLWEMSINPVMSERREGTGEEEITR